MKFTWRSGWKADRAEALSEGQAAVGAEGRDRRWVDLESAALCDGPDRLRLRLAIREGLDQFLEVLPEPGRREISSRLASSSPAFQNGCHCPNTLINLLDIRAACELIDPGIVASPGAGSRFQLTIPVDDVDAACAELEARGVELLNGPMNRAWGIRTAAFTDPGGHVWEFAQPLPQAKG